MTPLAGMRILDLTHALAGPFCTYHLGLFGADIIKIEPPGAGDDFRDFAPDTFHAVNGGKNSVTIDLKSVDGQKLLHDLVLQADVFIENFRPGVAEKLGLSWETLSALNDKLVYCSISGFGASGPRSRWPAVEWSVQAAMGISQMYLDEEDDPRDLGIGMLDVFSGTSAIIAILAALLERKQTGKGQRLDVTMADAALTIASPSIEPQISGRRVGKVPRRPGVGRFRAKDRRIFIMALHQRWFEKLAEVIGAPSLLEDDRFATQAAREAHAEALLTVLETRLADRNAAEWQDELLRAGVPAAVVSRLVEVIDAGYFEHTGMLHQQASANGETMRMVAGATFSGRTIKHAPGGAPTLGAQTEVMLSKMGIDDARIQDLKEKKVI